MGFSIALVIIGSVMRRCLPNTTWGVVISLIPIILGVLGFGIEVDKYLEKNKTWED